MRKRKIVIPQSWYVNAAAGSLAVFLFGFVVRDYLVKDEIAACSERYQQGTVFSLQSRTGELMSAPELQGRLAGNDLGVLENLQVIRLDQGPSATALRIRLAAVAPLETTSDAPRASANGVGFNWLPRRLPATPSTCLTYSFRMPEDFPMGSGGNLPGIVGGSDMNSADAAQATEQTDAPSASGFVTRPRWSSAGQMDLRVMTEDSSHGTNFPIDQSWLKIEPGRWMRLEQEVVLNTPGAADGIVRVWVDGGLKLEKRGIAFRRDKTSRVQGVVVNVGYNGKGEPPKTAKGKPSAVEISPFEVRWPE